MYDTICAICSGNVNSALGIIKIVGPLAVDIVKKIFSGKILENGISYGLIKDNNEIIDEVLVMFMLGKKNFVGEDTIEINTHGGIVVTKRILELIISLGARLANNGEFTRRAFLNGKISLIKAEAINDLINAKTTKQQQIAINAFNKDHFDQVNYFLKELEYLIGLCEVNIDYPEYDDIPILENNEFVLKVNKLFNEINNLVNESQKNLSYFEPLKVTIVGQPNAGKSALLNSFLNEEKSIVTDIEGTTRDVIESEIIFNNHLIKFLDTAGIRDHTNDIIEQKGIEKSFKTIKEANIILHVIDLTKDINNLNDKKINNFILENITKDQTYIKVYNKKDLIKDKNNFDIKENICISALNNDLNDLIEYFKKILTFENSNNHQSYNQRQTSCLKKCKNALSEAIDGINLGYTYDVIIVNLHEAWSAIKEIIGNVDKEELLDSIFENFCLGK